MNMAQFSVPPNDIAVVSPTPLHRAAQPVQTVCARLIARGMSWTSLSMKPHCRSVHTMIANRAAYGAAGKLAALAEAEPRKRGRTGTLPARWPFPPAPAEATHVPAAVATVRGPRAGSLGNATMAPVSDRVSVKNMALDVVLVLAWGAMIPAFMWLGVVGGF